MGQNIYIQLLTASIPGVYMYIELVEELQNAYLNGMKTVDALASPFQRFADFVVSV